MEACDWMMILFWWDLEQDLLLNGNANKNKIRPMTQNVSIGQ